MNGGMNADGKYHGLDLTQSNTMTISRTYKVVNTLFLHQRESNNYFFQLLPGYVRSIYIFCHIGRVQTFLARLA